MAAKTKTYIANTIRAIVAEIQTKGWWNTRLDIGKVNTVCVLTADACPAIDSVQVAIAKALGVKPGGIGSWNDAHETQEELIADLLAAANKLEGKKANA